MRDPPYFPLLFAASCSAAFSESAVLDRWFSVTEHLNFKFPWHEPDLTHSRQWIWHRRGFEGFYLPKAARLPGVNRIQNWPASTLGIMTCWMRIPEDSLHSAIQDKFQKLGLSLPMRLVSQLVSEFSSPALKFDKLIRNNTIRKNYTAFSHEQSLWAHFGQITSIYLGRGQINIRKSLTGNVSKEFQTFF